IMRIHVLALACALAAAPAGAEPLSPADLQILSRVTYGATARDIGDYRTLGREAYIRRQLAYHGDDGLPRDARSAIAALRISTMTPEQAALELRAMRQAAQGGTPAEKAELQKRLRREFSQLDLEAFERRTLRALYSPYQLQEQLTWFWFNHFNVFQNKKQV